MSKSTIIGTQSKPTGWYYKYMMRIVESTKKIIFSVYNIVCYSMKTQS